MILLIEMDQIMKLSLWSWPNIISQKSNMNNFLNKSKCLTISSSNDPKKSFIICYRSYFFSLILPIWILHILKMPFNFRNFCIQIIRFVIYCSRSFLVRHNNDNYISCNGTPTCRYSLILRATCKQNSNNW